MTLLIILILVVAALAFCIVGFNHRLTVSTHSLESDKLEQPIKAVLLTDLHSSQYGKNQEELIAAIDSQQADLVLMAGDIADDKKPLEGTVQLLEGIAHKYPCYYVTGNHEFRGGGVKQKKELFRSYGVRVLEGEHERVEVNGQPLNICGVDDPVIGEKPYAQQLERAFTDLDPKHYTILLSHRPERFKQAAAYDCDLVLVGHAHGGHVRIPFIDQGLYAPNQGVLPRCTQGIHSTNGSSMIVSRGLSLEVHVVPRLYNPPELIVIDLKPA